MSTFVWVCERGHESLHSEEEIRLIICHPRCSCGTRLDHKLRRHPEPPRTDPVHRMLPR